MPKLFDSSVRIIRRTKSKSDEPRGGGSNEFNKLMKNYVGRALYIARG